MGNTALSCTSGEKSTKAQKQDEQYSKNAPTEKAQANGKAPNGDAVQPVENGEAAAVESEATQETSKASEEAGGAATETKEGDKPADESKPEQETAESKPEESSEAASGEATTSAAAPAAGSEDVELKIEEAGDKKEEPAAEKTETSEETPAPAAEQEKTTPEVHVVSEAVTKNEIISPATEIVHPPEAETPIDADTACETPTIVISSAENFEPVTESISPDHQEQAESTMHETSEQENSLSHDAEIPMAEAEEEVVAAFEEQTYSAPICAAESVEFDITAEESAEPSPQNDDIELYIEESDSNPDLTSKNEDEDEKTVPKEDSENEEEQSSAVTPIEVPIIVEPELSGANTDTDIDGSEADINLTPSTENQVEDDNTEIMLTNSSVEQEQEATDDSEAQSIPLDLGVSPVPEPTATVDETAVELQVESQDTFSADPSGAPAVTIPVADTQIENNQESNSGADTEQNLSEVPEGKMETASECGDEISPVEIAVEHEDGKIEDTLTEQTDSRMDSNSADALVEDIDVTSEHLETELQNGDTEIQAEPSESNLPSIDMPCADIDSELTDIKEESSETADQTVAVTEKYPEPANSTVEIIAEAANEIHESSTVISDVQLTENPETPEQLEEPESTEIQPESKVLRDEIEETTDFQTDETSQESDGLPPAATTEEIPLEETESSIEVQNEEPANDLSLTSTDEETASSLCIHSNVGHTSEKPDIETKTPDEETTESEDPETATTDNAIDDNLEHSNEREGDAIKTEDMQVSEHCSPEEASLEQTTPNSEAEEDGQYTEEPGDDSEALATHEMKSDTLPDQEEKKEDEKPAEEAKPAESKSEDTETPTKESKDE